jgi:hypothetical protein
MAEQTNGRPQWPDVLEAIRDSERRVRADIKDVKADVEENKEAIKRLEVAEARKEQATRDLFRTGNAIRTGTLLAIAVVGAVLGVWNLVGA